MSEVVVSSNLFADCARCIESFTSAKDELNRITQESVDNPIPQTLVDPSLSITCELQPGDQIIAEITINDNGKLISDITKPIDCPAI